VVLRALVSFALKVVVGLAIACATAALLSIAVDGRTWTEQFGIACLLVGAVALLLAFGGHSPGMRLGLQDQYLASFFPSFARRLGDPYSKTRVSDSAILAATGVLLLALGLLLAYETVEGWSNGTAVGRQPRRRTATWAGGVISVAFPPGRGSRAT
jgi:hypothetical protein